MTIRAAPANVAMCKSLQCTGKVSFVVGLEQPLTWMRLWMESGNVLSQPIPGEFVLACR